MEPTVQFISWFLNPPPVSIVPTEGLVAIASVAVVIWTGGFIVRGWMKSTAVALMAGMNSLDVALHGGRILVLLRIVLRAPLSATAQTRARSRALFAVPRSSPRQGHAVL